jgi:hypothetical protein
MADAEHYFGGDRLGASRWTLDQFLDPERRQILILGPNLYFLHLNRAKYRELLFDWLRKPLDRNAGRSVIDREAGRSVILVISQSLQDDFNRDAQNHLLRSKKTFKGWIRAARDETPSLNLQAFTVKATIRTSMTVADIDDKDGVMVVVPLITQPQSADRPFFVVQNIQHPGTFASYRGQIQALMSKDGGIKRIDP